jgi:uroporphyrinogen-III synthase
MSFTGLRVLALESRRAEEMAVLISKQDGEPFVAPSMREIPVATNVETFRFAERLFASQFDMMILLTGVGTKQLDRLISSRYSEGALAAALRRIVAVARGPKSVAALREMGVRASIVAPEPNTWREVLAATEGRRERRIAVQEYGRSNPELLEGLRARGAEVTPVRVYEWDLPEDAEPLREAARRLAAGGFDVVLFTNAAQIDHLARVAREQGIEEAMLAGLRKAAVASIGPTTTEALEEFDIHPAMEPSHAKIGLLVQEAAERVSARRAETAENGRKL